VSSQMVRYVNDRTLQRSFGGFLIVLAVLVWFGHLGEGDRSAPLPALPQVGIGSLAGALSLTAWLFPDLNTRAMAMIRLPDILWSRSACKEQLWFETLVGRTFDWSSSVNENRKWASD
jgi:hypothetical protein